MRSIEPFGTEVAPVMRREVARSKSVAQGLRFATLVTRKPFPVSQEVIDMAIVQWGLEPRPARELTSLQSEVNRLFSSFFEPSAARSASAPAASRGWYPAMDVVERDDHYVLRADLPGVREEDISVELDGDVLAVSGRREAEHDEQREGFSRIERVTGEFTRALTLPEGVDADKIEASYDRGVLEVRVPKPEQAQPRKVAISVGARPADIEG